jgi:tetratricopeptide (TPR) repeat protein
MTNSTTRLMTAIALGVTTAAATTPAAAVEANRDYYTARATREGTETLKNVEAFHLGVATDEMKARRFDRAWSDLEFILRYFPNHPQALAMLAEVCDVKWKDPRCDTDRWFQKAIDKNPQAFQTWVVYGIHLQYVNRIPAAIDSYKKAIELNPSSANAHYNLGLAYFDSQQFELANRQAQLAAVLGMSLPGLRDKLTRTGKWKMLDEDELRREIAAAPTRAAAPKAD